MKILLVNPNTSRAMTAKIAAAAREAAGPGVEIDAVCPEPGSAPAAIESHLDEVAAAVAVVDLIGRDLAVGGSDAYEVACFGDPGLDAARELTAAPVVGIAEAAMHLTSVAGRRFAIVTTLARTLGRARDLVSRYGMERACAAYAAVGVPVLALEETTPEVVTDIERACREALRPVAPDADGADAVVLGCAGMADLCHELTRRLGAPVVDGVAAAVGVAAAMVRAGVHTSARGEYAPAPRYTPEIVTL